MLPNLQETEKKLEASAVELDWYRTQATSIENKYIVLEKEISQHCRANEKDSSHHKKTEDELSVLRMMLASERSICCTFLTSLLDMLTSYSSQDDDSQTSLFDGDRAREMSWSELAVAVETSIRTLMNSLREAREEIKCCKIVMERQNSLLESAAVMHEDSVAKLALEEGEKEKQWEQRLVEIKKSYESMLMKSRGINGSIDFQSQRKDCEFELGELKRLNHRLERSSMRLRSQLSRIKDAHRLYGSDRACLLACVCLLAGSLFASQCQTRHLRLQKQLLLRLSSSGNVLPFCQVHHAAEQGKTLQGSGHSKFRTVVIVVLAVHRLRKWSRVSYWLLFERDVCLGPGATSVLPPCISHHGSRQALVGVASMGVASVADVARWLRSEQVLLDARRCFSGLQTSLDEHTLQERTEHVQKRHVDPSKWGRQELDREFMTRVLTCHHNFLEKMRNHFAIK